MFTKYKLIKKLVVMGVSVALSLTYPVLSSADSKKSTKHSTKSSKKSTKSTKVKAYVCHKTGYSFRVLQISENARNAHMAHGDIAPHPHWLNQVNKGALKIENARSICAMEQE